MRSITILATLALVGGCADGDAAGGVDTCPAALSVDAPPVWNTANPGQVIVVEGHAFSLIQTATDLDGDFFTYILVQKPDDAMHIDEGTGEISWTPAFDTVADCGGFEAFDVQIAARTMGYVCGQRQFIDVTRSFPLVVLNDEDEDGTPDVDENDARVDDDADGDGRTYTEEAALGTDDCVAD